MPTCTICPTELTGRQTRYCSPRCSQRGYARARQADGRRSTYAALPMTRARTAQLHAAARAKRDTTRRCANCGQPGVREDGRYCNRACAANARRRPPRVFKRAAPIDQRGVLRVAWESRDWTTVRDELIRRCHPAGDCLIWTGRRNRDGYAVVTIGSKRLSAYRVMALALTEADLGSLSVHHKCADGMCLAPAHLQLSTPGNNTAEMLHRRWYLARITELEEALSVVSPQHPALSVLPLVVRTA